MTLSDKLPLWTVLRTIPKSVSYPTPRSLYDTLDSEFRFTLDPCPLHAEGGLFACFDGLLISWAGERVYCNPPYGEAINDWLRRANEADVAVYLLPAKTDTRWWHRYAPLASEVRFLKGRLKNPNGQTWPFATVLLVFSTVQTLECSR